MTGFEKRIGQRHQVPPVPIAWQVPAKGRTWGRRKPAQPAQIIDLSVSGAAVRAPSASGVQVGQIVAIDLDGTQGQVLVRRITAAEEDTGTCTYGVEFAHPNGRLARQLATRYIPMRDLPGAEEWVGPHATL